MLLVPDQPLRQAIASLEDFPHAPQILVLSKRFDVSPEVLLRRIYGLRWMPFESSLRALVLVRGPRELIEYATFPPWLRTMFPRPARGVEFGAWFRARGSCTRTQTEMQGRRALEIPYSEGGSVQAVRFEAGSLAVYQISLERWTP
jgi:hypothetical protein